MVEPVNPLSQPHLADVRLNTAEVVKTNLEDRFENTGVVGPTAEPEAPPVYESMWEGLKSSGIVTGGLKYLIDGPVDTTPDPFFSWTDYVEQDKEAKELFKKYMDDPNGPLSETVLLRMATINNGAAAKRFVGQVKAMEEAQKHFAINPVSSFVGMVGGIGIDIIPTLLATGGLGALGAANRAGQLARLMVQSQRGQAAVRVGGFGATEGGVERYMQGLTDPSVTSEEVIMGTVLGGVLGGALGSLAPQRIGGIFREFVEETGEREAADVINAAKVQRTGSVGAAATDEPIQVQQFGAGSAGTNVSRGLSKVQPEAMQDLTRNPKARIKDISIKGAKEAEEGLTGNTIAADGLARIARISARSQDEIAGKAVRPDTVEDIQIALHHEVVEMEFKQQTDYIELVEKMYKFEGTLGKIFGRAKALWLNSTSGSKLDGYFGSARDKFITRKNFQDAADEIGILKGQEKDVTPEKVIPAHVLAKMDREQVADFMAFAEKRAADDSAFYAMWDKRLVDAGMMEEGDSLLGYRQQIYDRPFVTTHRDVVKTALRKMMGQEPKLDIIKNAENPWFKFVDDEGNPIEWDTMDDLRRLAPDKAQMVEEEWDAVVRRGALERKENLVELKEGQLKKFRVKTREELEQRFATKVEKDTKLYGQLERTLARLQKEKAPKTKITAHVKRMQKVETRLQAASEDLAYVRKLDDQIEQIDAFVMARGNAKQKVGLKKAAAGATRAVKSLTRKQMSDQLDEELDRIVDNMSTTGFAPSVRYNGDTFSIGSARTMTREINWGDMRHTDEVRQFLQTDPELGVRAYVNSVGKGWSFRHVFGNLGANTNDDYMKALRRKILSGYEDDKLKHPDKAAKINRDMLRTQKLLDDLLVLGTNRADPVGNFEAAVSGMTQIALLGATPISQIGDAVTLVIAGPRASTPTVKFLRRTSKDIKALLDEGAVHEAILIRGPNHVDGSRVRAFAGMDINDLTVPGTLADTTRRVTQEIGQLEAKMTLMRPMNEFLNTKFTIGLMHYMDTDFKNFAKLGDDLKSWYAMNGVDDAMAARIAKAMDDSHWKLSHADVRIPKAAEWSKKYPEELHVYERTVRWTQRSGIVDPGVFDRPTMRKRGWFRLATQFTSWAYAAADKLLPVMVQQGLTNPRDMRFVGGLLTSLFVSNAVVAGHKSRNGQFQQWMENWDTSQGSRDNIWEAVVRSPFMVGNSAMALEMFNIHAGGYANSMAESATGFKPFKEKQSRFQQNQGGFAALGPAAGLFLGTTPRFAHNVAEGDWHKAWNTFSKRAPLINAWYAQMAFSQLNKD